MSEKPIIFSTAMVRALLDNRKTQTRRCGYKPRYAVGDVLWVRETWCIADDGEVWYRADPSTDFANQCEPAEDRYRWRPSIHMSKWAARIWLRVTGVRQERLQEISDADCVVEGVNAYNTDGEPTPLGDETVEHIVFRSLWDGIYGTKPGRAWADNPMVCVYEFERTERPAPLPDRYEDTEQEFGGKEWP